MTYLFSFKSTSGEALSNVLRRAKAPWLLVLYSAAAFAFVAGAMAGRDAYVAFGIDPQLVTLLRFMAALKFGMAVGAVALTHWRLRHQVTSWLATSYVLAATIMIAAPGLIWNLNTVVLGAILFHTGLFSFLLLAKSDDGGRQALIAVAATRRRRKQQTEP